MLRAGLYAASFPYRWVVRTRNRRYDRGGAEIHQVAVPVVSVGNLTVGGTGKTPMVEWIARHLRAKGVRVAILSRGYGAEQGGLNDEALELELALPDVPHLQNPDRVASSAIAIEELATQLLLLDDGFQHRRLARDLDIVLLDASEPFGFDHVLPRGTLREPVDGLRRAGVVVLSRADMIGLDQREAIRRRALELSPQAAWCEVEHRAAALVDASGEASPIASLAGKSVAAFCGIGNPAGFRHTLDALGANVAAWREFPDHHNYTRGDVDAICTLARDSGAKLIVCTRKDLVKLRVAAIGGIPLRAIGVELRFLRGEDAMTGALRPIVERARSINSEMFASDEASPYVGEEVQRTDG
ncbi:MAG: tetraacyldisaccharide 4'-kinase [Pirellulales bacterium]|nr:tetraacyldisaccharide 4'-kinase [Pirellulales bacterium]